MFVIEAERLLADFLHDDMQTMSHCRRVAVYAVALCNELSVADDQKMAIRTAALLHDIGKSRIPKEILEKPGRLTEEEFMLIKQHSSFSSEILSRYDQLKPIIPYITHHHERVDGFGYPDGLSDGQIPFGARIISLADAFDAMTSNRPYGIPKTFGQAIDEVLLFAGRQFDEKMVEAFVTMVGRSLGAEQKESWRDNS